MIRKGGGPSDPSSVMRQSALTFDSDVRHTVVPEDGKWLDFSITQTLDLSVPAQLNALKAKYPAIMRKYNELTSAPGIKTATVWCVDVKSRKFFVIITKDQRDQQTFHAFDALVHEFP
jgi:hypothetical protein